MPEEAALDAGGHVAPAGQSFDCALDEAGIDRGATFTTDAVKRFKFERDLKPAG